MMGLVSGMGCGSCLHSCVLSRMPIVPAAVEAWTVKCEDVDPPAMVWCGFGTAVNSMMHHMWPFLSTCGVILCMLWGMNPEMVRMADMYDIIL